MPKFYDWLKQLINDPAVEVVPNRAQGREPGAPSRIDTPMFRAFEAAQRAVFPDAITLPSMLAHGDDERLKEASPYKEVEFIWRSVLPVVAAQ